MKKKIAILMISLIVFLPVAFAQSLTITKYSGQDGVNGYIKTQDQLNIEATARIPGERTIDPTQLKACMENQCDFFQNCNDIGNGYFNCSFFDPQISWFGQPFQLTVKLFDDIGNLAKKETKEIVVDSIPPEIKNFELNTNFTRGAINIHYKAEDYGLQYNNAQKCSGIKTVVITADGTPIVTEYGDRGLCEKERTFSYTFDTTEKHTFTVCAQATDMLGQLSNIECEDVTIDNSGPDIENFAFYDPQGYEITHVKSGQSITVSAEAEITDDSEVLLKDVSADILGTGFIRPQKKENDYFFWKSIQIKEISAKKVTIKAKDILGNEAVKDFQITIPADDTPPELIELKTQKTTTDGKPLLGYDTNIIAVLEDKDNEAGTGAGFHAGKAYLDLSSLGLNSKVQADSCEQTSGAQWECKWKVKPVNPSGMYLVTLTTDTQDDLGNKITQAETITVVYDNSPPKQPQLISYEVISPENRKTPSRGDSVKFVIRSADFERAVANFTEIGGEAEEQGTCTAVGNGTEYDCMFQSEIKNSGPYTATLEFNFYDEADNKATFTHTLSVYTLADDINPNYWGYTYECMPSNTLDTKTPLINRQLAEQINQLITCKINLFPSSPYPSTVNVASITGPTSVEGCTAEEPLYFEDVFLTNGGLHSKHPILMFRMAKDDYDINQTTITCPIYITTEINKTTITKEPERENINITIKFYKEPLGNLYDNWEKQIKDKLKDIEDIAKWIGYANDVIEFSQGLCELKQVLVNMFGAIQTFLSIFGSTADVMTWIPGVGPAIKEEFTATCVSGDTAEEAGEALIDEALQAFCAIANCQGVTGIQGAGKYLGGGLPWCTAIEEWLQGWTGYESLQAFEDAGIPLSPGAMLNVKDSLVWSTACLCLPGIIHNVQKYLENECQFTTCLINSYKEWGVPRSFCSDQYAYQQCAYVVGEIWNAIPASQFFDMISDMLAEWIANPFTVVGTTIGIICIAECPAVPSTGHTLCAIPRVMTLVSETINSIIGMVEAENLFGPQVETHWCDDLLKEGGIKDKWEESKS